MIRPHHFALILTLTLAAVTIAGVLLATTTGSTR